MDSEEYGLLYFFLFILRIVITIYCVNRARKLNRNVWGWGIFGFLLPIVALIWIQFMKPRLFWDKNPDLKSKDKYLHHVNPKAFNYNNSEIRFWLGLFILCIGILSFAQQLFPNFELKTSWPIIFVIFGVVLIVKEIVRIRKSNKRDKKSKYE